MAVEVVDCEEFGEIQVRVSRLIVDGELNLDERVAGRGYLNVALSKGQVVFRADRHVGLIPVTGDLAVRVRPRATIANLSYMLARSGVAPVAIPDFSRGYLPRFEVGTALEKLYARSLLVGVERVIGRGFMKSYVHVADPPPWRGRLLASDTIRRHAAHGVRYRHEFAFSTLSIASVENVALREALLVVRSWMERNDRKNPDLVRFNRAIDAFDAVPAWTGRRSALVSELGRRVALVPSQFAHYRDPLWTAFLLLQGSLPDVGADGSVSLDSLIVDVSKVFEAYTRRVLVDRAARRGWSIRDGNLKPSTFFTDTGDYEVRPDVVVASGATPIAVLDAKYKPHPKESDRYEVLSFMDALNVKVGGFVCPAGKGMLSRFMGTTAGGKRMSCLRFDLAATNPEAEADRLFENACRLVDGDEEFI